jgi:hypothetical protein
MCFIRKVSFMRAIKASFIPLIRLRFIAIAICGAIVA